MQSCSNFARVIFSEKSRPSTSPSISTRASGWVDSCRLAASEAFLSRASARSSAKYLLPVVHLDQSQEVLHQAVVEVLPSEVGVPSCRKHLEEAALDLQQRHVETSPRRRSNTSTLLSPVRSSPYAMAAAVGSFTTRTTFSPAMVPASLVDCRWAIVKVCRHSDHGVHHLFPKVLLCYAAHLPEHHRRHLLRGEPPRLPLVLHLHLGRTLRSLHHVIRQKLLIPLHCLIREPPSDESLHRVHCVARVVGHLVPRPVSDEPFGVSEGHNRRCYAISKLVRNDLHSAVVPHPHHRVRGSQIDPNHRTFRWLMSEHQPCDGHRTHQDEQEGARHGLSGETPMKYRDCCAECRLVVLSTHTAPC
eukprot:Sspe_Gene.30833::Locus_15229_Transcript_2_2_Confidence_0.400_Length_2383::g.30833::m.30833